MYSWAAPTVCAPTVCAPTDCAPIVYAPIVCAPTVWEDMHPRFHTLPAALPHMWTPGPTRLLQTPTISTMHPRPLPATSQTQGFRRSRVRSLLACTPHPPRAAHLLSNG